MHCGKILSDAQRWEEDKLLQMETLNLEATREGHLNSAAAVTVHCFNRINILLWSVYHHLQNV